MTHARRRFVFALTVGALWAGPVLAADDPQWAVNAAGPGAGTMSRTIDTITLAYKRLPGEDDSLLITVRDCGDEPWHMEESLNGVTAETLRDTVKEEFENARLNCKLAEDIEPRMMAGFDEAFAKVKPFLPPHVQMVGGWTLEDRGGQPGDDSQRTVTVSKALANIAMVYRPGESGEGASIQLDFKPCKGLNASSGFDFGNPPEDHFKVITEEVAEQYSDFAKDCKTAPEPQAVLMQDFFQALKTIEQWLHDRPFTYPPEAPSSDKEQ